jgi:hypothetical protein
MNEIIEFLNENYWYVMGIGLVLVFILIGFLVSNKGGSKKNKKEEETMANINEVKTGEINQVASNLDQQNVQPMNNTGVNEPLVNGQNQMPVQDNIKANPEPMADINPIPQVNEMPEVGTTPVQDSGVQNIEPVDIGSSLTNDALLVEKEPVTPVMAESNSEPKIPNNEINNEQSINLNPIQNEEPTSIENVLSNNDVQNNVTSQSEDISAVDNVQNDIAPPTEEISTVGNAQNNEQSTIDYVSYVPDNSNQTSNDNILNGEETIIEEPNTGEAKSEPPTEEIL